MSETRVSARLKLLLLAALFVGPLVAAVWLYYGGGNLQPERRTNAGRLLEPIVNIDDELGEGSLGELIGGRREARWLLVYMNEGPCADPCRAALYRMRQSRLMLGPDMERLERVFLHGETPPDKVLIEREHHGLITIRNRGLGRILDRKRPADLPTGGLFLIDPLGNLVMYFAGRLAPEDMVGDIEHLLELSRIG